MSSGKKSAVGASASASEKPFCPICIDPYTNQVHRKPVSCAQCGEMACVRCLKTYITSSTEDPHCPSCRKAWTYDYICQLFPKTWYNGEFKQRRQEILMDRERSRLPESQAWAERMQTARNVYQPLVSEKRRELFEINKELRGLKFAIDMQKEKYGLVPKSERTKTIKEENKKIMTELREKLRAVERKKFQIQTDLDRNNSIHYGLMHRSDEEIRDDENYERFRAQVRAENPGIDRQMEQVLIQSLMATVNTKVKAPGRVFTMKCPGAECRGFLSTAYKCGICDRSTCAHCLVQYPIDDPKGEAHTCSEDDKKTVELIKKSCRNCPCCGMSIFRIEGCNQMFCTACNTAFDWATGQLLNTRQIHNPHYTDYLRRMDLASASASASAQGTQTHQRPGLNPCGADNQRLDYHYISREYLISMENTNIHLFNENPVFYSKQYFENNLLMSRVREVLRLNTHIRGVDIPHYQRELRRLESNQKMNAEYLIGIYTAEQWKKRIMVNEVKRLAYNETIQGLQAFTDVCQILYGNFTEQFNTYMDTIPPAILKYINRNQFLTRKEHENYTTQFNQIEPHYKALLDTMQTLWTQVAQMIDIMNEKTQTIIKTYKIQLQMYMERVEDHKSYFRPITMSYTSLYGTTRPRAPLGQRPATAPVRGGLHMEREMENLMGQGEDEDEDDREIVDDDGRTAGGRTDEGSEDSNSIYESSDSE